MSAKKGDWPSRLAAHIEGARRTVFAWGQHDCVTFAGDWSLIATGQDRIAPARGRYKTAAGALRAMKRHYGTDDLIGAVRRELGAPLRSVLLAQRGDVAAMETPEAGELKAVLGIVTGAQVALLSRERGLVFRPLSDATAVWRL